MLERFHANRPPTQGSLGGHLFQPNYREALSVQGHRPTGGVQGVESFFNSTLN